MVKYKLDHMMILNDATTLTSWLKVLSFTCFERQSLVLRPTFDTTKPTSVVALSGRFPGGGLQSLGEVRAPSAERAGHLLDTALSARYWAVATSTLPSSATFSSSSGLLTARAGTATWCSLSICTSTVSAGQHPHSWGAGAGTRNQFYISS